MPFKQIDIESIVNEKRKNSEFNINYLEIKREYELKRQLIVQ